MRKYSKLLAALLVAVLLVACTDDSANSEEKSLSKAGMADRSEDVVPVVEVEPEVEKEQAPEEPEEEEPAGFTPPPLDSHVTRALTSRAMREFEAENAVSPEQERYLAFGAYVLTNNRESIRVFALGESGDHAASILRDFWGVEDRASAMEQLEQLSTASGQSPAADDMYRTLIVNGQELFVDGMLFYMTDYEPIGLENVYQSAERRVERMEEDIIDYMMVMLEIDEEEREELIKLLVYEQFAERIINGLEAYVDAKELLIDFLGFTEEELLSLPSLAAWDYGRVAIIARYGVAAGYLREDVAWEYLQAAAENAAEIYTCWRQYTAAHILGRALAFGNNSDDFKHSLNFLLHHPESSFQTIDFK